MGDRAKRHATPENGDCSFAAEIRSRDFSKWLRVFDVCAAANEWDAGAKLVKLPAFLRGPALAYYSTLTAAQKNNYGSLTTSLKALL